MEEIEKGALEKAGAHGRKLAEGFTKILKEQSIPAVVQGPDTMPGIVFTEKERVNEFRDWSNGDHGFYEDVIQAMFKRGVMPDIDSREPFFTCAAHTDEDADVTLGVFEEAVKEVNSKR